MARVNEVGGALTLTYIGVNLATATKIEFWVYRANGTLIKVTPTLISSGADSVVRYYWVAGDLNCSAVYTSQIYAEFPGGGVYLSSIYSFTIDGNVA